MAFLTNRLPLIFENPRTSGKQMNTKQVDYLNILLLLLSLFFAFLLPFELFLFSYAFLGPLHYLTEINWLKEKNYFLKKPKWIFVFFLFAIIISIPVVLKIPYINYLLRFEQFYFFGNFLSKYAHALFLLSLFAAFGFVAIPRSEVREYFFIGVLVFLFLLIRFDGLRFFHWIIFLPTIIHVYLFTLLFMIYGSSKSGSKPGLMAILMLMAVPFVIAFIPFNFEGYTIEGETRNMLISSGFNGLGKRISTFFPTLVDSSALEFSPQFLKIQVFIAFAYTYHYLNWFSKTSLIGWGRNISLNRMIWILAVWVMAVLLYIYNYALGLSVLFTLSTLHVFLELPLNATTIKGVFASVQNLVGKKS